MAIENLWGQLPTGDGIRPPTTLLQEQKKILEDATNGLLLGQIVTSSAGGSINAVFSIVAPLLNNYAFTILQLSHPITLYPVRLIDHVAGQAAQAANESDLRDNLRKILGNPKIKDVVGGLLAQIKTTK